MFPSVRHRLIIIIAVLVGGFAWLSAIAPLTAAEGSSGISLMSSRIGTISACGLVMAAGLPALALGLVVSASGNPLAGVFGGATALALLAAYGGSIEGWYNSMADRGALPSVYRGLMVELVIWYAGLVAMLILIQRFRPRLRKMLPILAFDDHLGAELQLRLPRTTALSAGLVCAVVGGLLGSLFLQSSQTAQVMVGLFIAFAIGGLIGHLLFPQTNPVAILMSSGVVALIGYGCVLFQFDTQLQMLKAWNDDNLSIWHRVPALAQGLPIHFASSAVAGSALGIGWAQGILVDHRPQPEAGPKPKT